MTEEDLKDWIKACEGFRAYPYLDTVGVGKVTIGFGRNIDDNGISVKEAEFMLDNDIARCKEELAHYDWYNFSPENVQAALMNMCFNLGLPKLLGFKKMISAIENQDYKTAAIEALNSRWAEQVGKRAKDVALMMREQDAQAGTNRSH